MHAASRHRSFKLIVRFPGTDDPDVPVINVAQLQTHTQEEVSSSTSFPSSHAKNPAPRSTAHTSSTHNQHGYNYTQVVLFRARKHKPVPSPPPQIWLSQKHHEQKRTHILRWSQSHTPKWNHERKQTSSLDNNHNGPPNTYSNETLSWALSPNLDLLEYIQTVLHKRLHLYRNMKHVWNICVNTDQTTSIQHCLMSTSNNASSLQRHWSRLCGFSVDSWLEKSTRTQPTIPNRTQAGS